MIRLFTEPRARRYVAQCGLFPIVHWFTNVTLGMVKGSVAPIVPRPGFHVVFLFKDFQWAVFGFGVIQETADSYGDIQVWQK